MCVYLYMSVSLSMCVSWLLCSIFEGGTIPYPKRDFLAEDEPEEKTNTGAKRPNCDTVSRMYDSDYQSVIF